MRRPRRGYGDERRAGIALTYLLCTIVCLGTVVTYGVVNQDVERSASWQAPHQDVSVEGVSFALQPLGYVPDLVIQRHASVLEERFDASVTILEAMPLPDMAWDAQRKQFRADLLLDALFIQKPPGFSHIVGVTTGDLYADGWDFLYGFSQVQGRVVVMSIARAFPSVARGVEWAETGLARADKVLLHEVGHTYELSHCGREHCVMSTVDNRPGLDHLSRFFCAQCARRASAAAVTPPEQPGIARGDGLFQRGAFELAWVHYTMAFLQRPTDVTRLNRLGVSSATVHLPRMAEQSYQLAIRLDPDYSLPFYNYGLLYASVDTTKAVALLKAGFERDPDRVEALGFLGTIYVDVLQDEHRAMWYFQRYVREGGQNPDVLYRYRSLMRPELVRFQPDEVPVIRGRVDPANGDEAFLRGIATMERLITFEDGIRAGFRYAHGRSRRLSRAVGHVVGAFW